MKQIKFKNLIKDMKSCEQTQGQSVLEHGISVKNYTFDLINHLKYNTPLKYDWKLPDWLYENKDLFINNLPSDKTIKYYTVLHDGGKPYCVEVDMEKNISQVMLKYHTKYSVRFSMIKQHPN